MYVNGTVRETETGEIVSGTQMSPDEALTVPSFSSPQEMRRFKVQSDYSRPHVQPGSVCITTTGTMYKPSVWKALVDMFMLTNKQGINCWISEVKDPRAGLPYASLGAMMDLGVMQAQSRGFEYVCLVQTDVLPEPELLANLLEMQVAIAVPMIIDPNTEKGMGGPMYEPNQGIKPLRWCPISFILFRTSVFNCSDSFFTGQVTEDMMWERFWRYGHQPVQNTDLVLNMASYATRHGNLTLPEQWDWMCSVDERRRQKPDRSSPNSDEHHVNGIYAPWTKS